MKTVLIPKKSTLFIVLTMAILCMTGVVASAHTTINPPQATAGGYGAFAFRVPNESDTASTIKLEVAFPEEHPIASVRITDQDGWNAIVEKGAPNKKLEAHGKEVKEVVKKITWEGKKIEPGKYADFHVSMGPLPEDAEQLVFKAVQTYDDGNVSRWIEEVGADGKKPEKPAPVLTLLKVADDDKASADTPSSSKDSDKAEIQESESGNNALVYAGVGIGALALLVALGALLKK